VQNNGEEMRGGRWGDDEIQCTKKIIAEGFYLICKFSSEQVRCEILVTLNLLIRFSSSAEVPIQYI